MVSGMSGAAAYTFQTTGMMFSYTFDIQDPFKCDVLNFSLFPIVVNIYTFVMLSVDKFIAIKFALRYEAIVTHRRAYQVIAVSWIAPLLLSFTKLIYELIFGSEHNKSSRFGSYSIKQHWAALSP